MRPPRRASLIQKSVAMTAYDLRNGLPAEVSIHTTHHTHALFRVLLPPASAEA
jgi:hypothetical protein